MLIHSSFVIQIVIKLSIPCLYNQFSQTNLKILKKIYFNFGLQQIITLNRKKQMSEFHPNQQIQNKNPLNQHSYEHQSTEKKKDQSIQGDRSEDFQSLSQNHQKPQVDYEGLVSLKIFQKKINDSLELKIQGNQYFKTSQYKEAIQKYSQGLNILDPKHFYGATQSECQKMAEVSASLLFNIGLCFFNLESWKQAEIYFSQTLLINPNHIKAIFKRALCRYQCQNYDNAMTDIKQAFAMDKSNQQIYESYGKILQKYNTEVKKAKEEMKQISTKIFRKDSQKSSKLQSKQEIIRQNQKPQQINSGEQKNGLWKYSPLVLVAGVALVFVYKRWFSK